EQRLQGQNLPAAERAASMLRANPLYVLRNHLAQAAIDAAAQGDASEIETLLSLLRQPYEERPGFERYAEQAPAWAGKLAISCSS
ncbi:MAG: hypothetical protein GX772_02265, partial [Alcaligenaceae bacterium]|nr:hypothetical protein [Alcaligenaceae bacterium]